MRLSQEQIEHLAKLARIELSEEEKEKLAESIAIVLDYVNQLQKVNTDNVKPTSQVTGLFNVFRKDEEEKREEESKKLIEMAPEKEGREIKVKSVLE